MAELDPVELEQFNNLVDNITDDIEAGRTKANPLANTGTVGEVVTEDLEVIATATERGEADVAQAHAENEAEAQGSAVMPEIIGKISSNLVEITNKDGVVTLYGSAAVAADETDKSATFYRKYCKGELSDKEGNSYKYISKAML